MADHEDSTPPASKHSSAPTRQSTGQSATQSTTQLATPPNSADPAPGDATGTHRHPYATDHAGTAPHWLRTAAAWSWRLIAVAVAVGLVFWATSKVVLLFIAVFLALVMTAVLRPLVNLMSRVMPRGLATPLAMIFALAVFAGLLTYVGLSVAGQWKNLGEEFNTGIGTIIDFLEDSPLHITVTSEDVQDWLGSGQEWVAENSGTVASQVWSSVGSVGQVFAALALATFLAVFFLLRGDHMWLWFLNQLPARYRTSWFLGGGAAWYTFSGYTRGTFLVAGADGALAAIILLALGVPLAAPLAVLVFIGAFIPLIGAPLAMVIAMVVALAANGIWNAVFVGIGIALIGQFEGHVLEPLVMGRQVALHPVVVALAVTAGTLVAGILGAVIAVPLVSVAWAVFSLLRHKDPPSDFSQLDPEEELAEILDEAD